MSELTSTLSVKGLEEVRSSAGGDHWSAAGLTLDSLQTQYSFRNLWAMNNARGMESTDQEKSSARAATTAVFYSSCASPRAKKMRLGKWPSKSGVSSVDGSERWGGYCSPPSRGEGGMTFPLERKGDEAGGRGGGVPVAAATSSVDLTAPSTPARSSSMSSGPAAVSSLVRSPVDLSSADSFLTVAPATTERLPVSLARERSAPRSTIISQSPAMRSAPTRTIAYSPLVIAPPGAHFDGARAGGGIERMESKRRELGSGFRFGFGSGSGYRRGRITGFSSSEMDAIEIRLPREIEAIPDGAWEMAETERDDRSRSSSFSDSRGSRNKGTQGCRGDGERVFGSSSDYTRLTQMRSRQRDIGTIPGRADDMVETPESERDERRDMGSLCGGWDRSTAGEEGSGSNDRTAPNGRRTATREVRAVPALKIVPAGAAHLTRRSPKDAAGPVQPFPWRKMVASPAAWACVAGNVGAGTAINVLISWLPSYYEDFIQVDLEDIGLVAQVRVTRSREASAAWNTDPVPDFFSRGDYCCYSRGQYASEMYGFSDCRLLSFCMLWGIFLSYPIPSNIPERTVVLVITSPHPPPPLADLSTSDNDDLLDPGRHGVLLAHQRPWRLESPDLEDHHGAVIFLGARSVPLYGARQVARHGDPTLVACLGQRGHVSRGLVDQPRRDRGP